MSSNQHEAMDVPGVRRAIRHRKRFILASIAVFGLLGLVLNVLTPPVYRATARLEVRKPADRSAWTGQSYGSSNFQSENVALYTTAELMTNRTLLAKLAGDLNAPGNLLAEREPASWMPKWLRVPVARAQAGGTTANAAFGAPDPVRVSRQVDWLERAVRVEPVRDTRLVDVVVEDSDPRVAKGVADKLSNLVVAEQWQRSTEDDTVGLSFLGTQLAEVRGRIERASQELYGTEASNAAAQARAQQMQVTAAGLAQAYVQAASDRVAATSRLSRLRKGADESAPGVSVDNDNLNTLRRNLQDTEAQIASASEIYGSRHPKLVTLQAQEQQLRAQIQSETKRSVSNLRGEASALRARESELRSAMSRAQGAVTSAVTATHRNAALENELKADEELYNRLLSRYREAGYEERMSAPMVSVVSPASVAQAPIRPRPYMNLLVCLAAGALVGVGLAVARDASRRSIRYPEDVERQLDLPVLAVLPKTA